jgi:hypothetical protein
MIGNRAFCQVVAREPPMIAPPNRQLPGGLPKDAQMVDLDKIEYTQPGIAFSTREKQTLGRMAAWMLKYGWRLSQPADIVKMADGRLVSLDHRRLWAAQRAGLKQVSARVHAADDALSNDVAGRFAIQRGQVPMGTNPVTNKPWQGGDRPKTWGDAVRFRSAVQEFGKAGHDSDIGYNPGTLPGGAGVRDRRFPPTGSKDPPRRMQPGDFDRQEPYAGGGTAVKSGGNVKTIPSGRVTQGTVDTSKTPPQKTGGGGGGEPSVIVDPDLQGGGNKGGGANKGAGARSTSRPAGGSFDDDNPTDITGGEDMARSGLDPNPTLLGMLAQWLWGNDFQRALQEKADALMLKQINEEIEQRLKGLAYLTIGLQSRGDIVYAQITIEHTITTMGKYDSPLRVMDLVGLRVSEWFRRDRDSSTFEGVSTVKETNSYALRLHPLVIDSVASNLAQQIASSTSPPRRDLLQRCLTRLREKGPKVPAFSFLGGECLDVLPMGSKPPSR